MESAFAPAARCPVSKLGPPRATKSGPVTLCGSIRQTGETRGGRAAASAVGGTQPVSYRYRFSVVSESFFQYRRGQTPGTSGHPTSVLPPCEAAEMGMLRGGRQREDPKTELPICDVCAKTQVSIRGVYDESLIPIVEIIGFKNATNCASKGTSRFATQGARKGTS